MPTQLLSLTTNSAGLNGGNIDALVAASVKAAGNIKIISANGSFAHDAATDIKWDRYYILYETLPAPVPPKP